MSMRFDLKFFFAYSQNIDSPESFILRFFTRKVTTVTFIEEATLACKALSIESMVGEVF